MAHLRTQIFNAIRAALIANPEFSDAGKVERGRDGSIPQELLPALTLTWSEADEGATIRPCSGPNGEDGYDRELPVTIVVHMRDDNPEEEFDRLCVLIEGAMGATIKLGGLAVEATLVSSRHFVNDQTGVSLGVGRLAYRVHYKTVAADPQTVAA